MKKDITLKLRDIPIEEILDRRISRFGTGCHIIVPQKHKDKKSIVIIIKNNKNEF